MQLEITLPRSICQMTKYKGNNKRKIITTLEPTSAQALRTASVSMVAVASLYSWLDVSLSVWTLANEEARSWWTRRRSRRSLTTPLAIQALHTCRGEDEVKGHVWLPGQ